MADLTSGRVGPKMRVSRWRDARRDLGSSGFKSDESRSNEPYNLRSIARKRHMHYPMLNQI